MRDTLTLTLPPEDSLARLGRLAARHFLRRHGVRAVPARLSARLVEARCRGLMKRRPPARGPVVLAFTAGDGVVRVEARRTGAGTRTLLEVAAPARR